MEIKVNPTRMELLKLKKREKMARRGHKLLKDKRDELMRVFLELVEETRKIRREVEEKTSLAFQSFLLARGEMSPAALEEALLYPTEKISLQVGKRNLMNTPVPVFTLEQEGDAFSYGFASTVGELDISLNLFSDALAAMVRLAQVEKSVELLAEEIEKTRRRVNALEYVMIPKLESTVKSIAMKLSEQERSNATRLMKIKDIVRSH